MRICFVLLLTAMASGCHSPSTDDWLAQLQDSSVVKRREAIRELGSRSLESNKIIPALINSLRDESSYVRHDAAWAIGRFGADAHEAVPALTAALGDEARSVQAAAWAALKKIDPIAARRAGVK